MHKRTTLRALAAATMSLGLGLAALTASAADTGPIKIGLVLPMTGQQASTGRQIDARQLIIDGFGGTYLHTPERVHDSRESPETQLRVVIKMQTGGFFNRLREQRCTALRKRRVDLVLAITGNVHI